MKLPIFVVDAGGVDMRAHFSLDDVLASLEAIDVRRGEYVAYDAEGRLLRLGVVGEHITLEETEDLPAHSVELEAALREYLTAVGDPAAEHPTCDLPRLVRAFLSRSG